MKKVFFTSLIGLIFVYGFTTIQTTDNCDKKTLTTSCKKKIAYRIFLSMLIVHLPLMQLKFTEIILNVTMKKRGNTFLNITTRSA